jgi:hypothetical protein
MNVRWQWQVRRRVLALRRDNESFFPFIDENNLWSKDFNICGNEKPERFSLNN